MNNNCFTEFSCFLSNLNMNQPQVYVYTLPFESPSHLLPHCTILDWYRAPVWVSWAIQQIPIGDRNVSFHVTLSIHLILSSPLPMYISLLSMSVSPFCPANKFFSTIFLDSIYMHYNMVFIFLFLAHFTLYNMFQVHPPHRNWLKCIPFYGRVIFHCVYVPQLLYPFICRWTSRLLPCSSYCK